MIKKLKEIMHEKPPENLEMPRQFQHKPELQLCWRGLIISVSEGFMTRKQAVEVLNSLDRENNQEEAVVIDLAQYRDRLQTPPDAA